MTIFGRHRTAGFCPLFYVGKRTSWARLSWRTSVSGGYRGYDGSELMAEIHGCSIVVWLKAFHPVDVPKGLDLSLDQQMAIAELVYLHLQDEIDLEELQA